MSGSKATGALLTLIPPKDGGSAWQLKQADMDNSLSSEDQANRREINWYLGPIWLTGYVDKNTLDVGISPVITGINAGNITGNLKDGVAVNVDLTTTKGETRLYLKNGNEVWVDLNLNIFFSGNYERDCMLFRI
ncbi:hypothetical protein FCULG_00012138 [Fusarium culmorum]|uniref:Uncharacterized protein n=1 Tax=Fusarium culmorum TaxID=5516 RepID=A0A2T4GFA4_FUSCU|nr:hypothetical protein FCULG_00012138 [Fusarium culmorum]